MEGFKNVDLIKESDRGCVLVAAALLESLLEENLRRVIKSNGMSNRYLAHTFDANGPLGTFSAKILMSKGFGLINENIFNDLMVIRKLRNEFAHSVENADFTDKKIIARIDSLSVIDKVKDETKGLQRYDPVKSDTMDSEGLPLEWRLQAAGYVKYHKSLFCLAVHSLEIEILKFFIGRVEMSSL